MPAIWVGLAFFALTVASIWILKWSKGLPVFWPGPGLLLAYLATSARHDHLQAIFWCGLGGFAAMVLLGWSWNSSAMMVALALMEELIAFRLLTSVRGKKIDWFDNLDGLLAFILIAGILAPALFAIPASYITAADSAQPISLIWLSWFASDGLGGLIVTPLLFLLFNGTIAKGLAARNRNEMLTMAVAVLTVGAVSAAVFWQNIGPFLFLPLFPIMVAAFKMEQAGALLSVLLLMVIGIGATWHGHGPITAMMGDSVWALQSLQLYIATVLLIALPASVELSHRRTVTRNLRSAMKKITDSERNAQIAANTDSLTGLLNRRGFVSALEEAVDGDFHITLALIDVDDFKAINDRRGHLVGDTLLRRLASRYVKAVPCGGILARLGGDEFAVLVVDRCPCDPEELGAALSATLNKGMVIGGHEFQISASCGIVHSPAGELRSSSRLLARADVAMYHAKCSDMAQWMVFTSDMEADERRKTLIIDKLATPEGRGEVELVYQPIFNLRTGAIASVEALARWDCPGLGRISPAEFIPLAERGRLIRPLTWHLLRTALRECAALPPGTSLSFNVSGVHICTPNFSHSVLRALERAAFDPAKLKLEVTETALLADSEQASKNCRDLQRQGIRIVLDDFGAGYASVSYLRMMSFDEIKLDSSLTLSARTEEGLSLAKGVIDLCNALGNPCIAEHLELKEDVARFRNLGCKFGQGYGLQKPVGTDELFRSVLTHRGVGEAIVA